MSDNVAHNDSKRTEIIRIRKDGKIYRRNVSPGDIRHSVSCYKLSERLGLGVVPYYEQVSADLTVETWIEGLERLEITDIMTTYGAKIGVLDFIVAGGALDRFSWLNAKVTKHGKVWAFDNTKAFGILQDTTMDWELTDKSVFLHLWSKCDSFGNGSRGTTDHHSVIQQVINDIAPKLETSLLQGLELTEDETHWTDYRIGLLRKYLSDRHTLAKAWFDWRRFVYNGILRGAWVPLYVTAEQTIPYLKYPLTPNSVVIDLGGAEGEEAQFFNSTYGCQVVTLDPRPEAAEFLRGKFEGNPNIAVIEAAVTRHDGTAIMGNTGHSASVTLNGDPQERPISGGTLVQTIRLKTLLDKLSLMGNGRADLIRMNCEGGEMLVLRDIDETMADRIDQLSFVIHTQMFPLSEYYKEINRIKKWYTVLVDKDTPYDRHFLLINRKLWNDLATG